MPSHNPMTPFPSSPTVGSKHTPAEREPTPQDGAPTARPEHPVCPALTARTLRRHHMARRQTGPHEPRTGGLIAHSLPTSHMVPSPRYPPTDPAARPMTPFPGRQPPGPRPPRPTPPHTRAP